MACCGTPEYPAAHVEKATFTNQPESGNRFNLARIFVCHSSRLWSTYFLADPHCPLRG
jgi:hypothetical protein